MRIASGALLASLVILTAGCGPSGPSPEERQAEAERLEQAASLQAAKACISQVFDRSVLKRQSDAETQAALDTQELTNCPSDFVQAFVEMRSAAREVVATRADVLANGRDGRNAVGSDILNLGCSLFKGEQCAPFRTGEWMAADAALQRRIAANDAALRGAVAKLESAAGRYGIYIQKPQASSGDPAINADMGPANGTVDDRMPLEPLPPLTFGNTAQ